jgi:acetyl esterase/lipase
LISPRTDAAMTRSVLSKSVLLSLAAAVLCVLQIGCDAGAVPDASAPVSVDRTCDDARFPSAAWTLCETRNFARLLEAPTEQLAQPAFVQRELAQSIVNTQQLLARDARDPSWLLASSQAELSDTALLGQLGALTQTLERVTQSLAQNPGLLVSSVLSSVIKPVAATYALGFAGDPFRYPASPGPDGRDFYDNEALVMPVVFYDSDCARLSGRVWQPRSSLSNGKRLPGVVPMNGSFGAPETLLWWAAQMLVRDGYVVLSFDPRGQGRSDMQTPDGKKGSNDVPSIFWTGLVDAIDFFRSSPAAPYPNNLDCESRYPTAVAAYNPAHAVIDPDRLGLAGHSAGALAVTIVQGYGAEGADPWPGKLDRVNPVKVVVGWDGIADPATGLPGNAISGGVLTIVTRIPLIDQLLAAVIVHAHSPIVPRVPSLSLDSEYGVLPSPYLLPPKADTTLAKFKRWTAAGVPWYDIVIQGAGHLEWSLTPQANATSWCPSAASTQCSGGWANALSQHYTLAWMDRWLKQPGEPGYADADARLLDDSGPQGASKLSFHFRSARHYIDRDGVQQGCENIRAGC